MAIDLAKYQALQAKVAAAQQQVARAEGALATVGKQLREEFGCKNLAAAKKLLKEKEAEAANAEEEFNKALAAFEKEWGSVLEGDSNNGG